MTRKNTSSNPSDPTRTISSGSRILRVLSALKGRSTTGVSNADLALGLDLTPGTVNRLLNTAINEGWARKLDNGRFALGDQALRIAQAHAEEISRNRARLTEEMQRLEAGSLS